MSKKTTRKKPAPFNRQQESVFREAWQNMNADMARVMPAFLAKRLQGNKGKLWVVVAVTLVELVVLGLIGKFAYDWFTN